MPQRSGSLVAACSIVLLVACGGGVPQEQRLSVEETFASAGPASILQGTFAGPGGLTLVLYYPSTMESDGFLNPVVVYGNGTGAVCTQNGFAEVVGRHLASWGFVVACPEVTEAGYGAEVLETLRFMVAENVRDGSVFRGQLDTGSIGAAGHSQGATGALNANVLAAGAIRSTATLAFVDRALHGGDRPRLADVKGLVFLASGCDDPMTTEQDSYFDELHVPTARACRVGANHLTMVRASLGYAAAWFMYTLRGDATARRAFVGSDGASPEVPRNPAWAQWRSKQLP